MVRTFPMYKLTLDSAPEGTLMVAGEALSVGEMAQRIKEAMECLTDPSMDLSLVYSAPGERS